MAKYLAVMIAIAGVLVAVDSVEARGRRGGCAGGNCHTYSGGGCPGGVCYAPVGKAPIAQAPVTQAPKVVAVAPVPAAASVPVTRTTPRYTTTSNRRWFGRRS